MTPGGQALGPSPPDHPDENQIDQVVAQSSMFPLDNFPDNFHPWVAPIELNGDGQVRPKTNNNMYPNNWQQPRRQNEVNVNNASMSASPQHLQQPRRQNEVNVNNASMSASPQHLQQQRRQNEVSVNNSAMLPSPPHLPYVHRNDVSPSVNSESSTMPVRRSAGQHAASVPASWRPEPSVHSYHPNFATSNATYSSSQPPSLPHSANSSVRSSRGRNSSGGSRASSSYSNTPILGSEAAAPPFLGSLQADSAHPSSNQGMRSLREEEEFPSIPDVRFYKRVTLKSPFFLAV